MNLRTSASPLGGAIKLLILRPGGNFINALKFAAAIALFSFGQVARAADPLDTWTLRSPLPTQYTLYGV